MKTRLSKLALDAIGAPTEAGFRNLENALASPLLPESFGVLADDELVRGISDGLNEPDLTKWLTRDLTWKAELYGPATALTPTESLLHILWQDLSTRLGRKLDAVGRRTALASRGAVLCFFGRGHVSIVVEYKRSGSGAFNLRPLAAQLEPHGVLELASLFGVETPETRNAIKNAALSVDKLVFQRGSIVHVDRQREDVFGPTIDTVILGELLAERLNELSFDDRVDALEVGPGSGLLSVILASSDQIKGLTAVDLNGAAVVCTLKNLQINDIPLDAPHQEIRVRAERFISQQFTGRFDLVVCNPPYIPEQPDTVGSSKEYSRAVGGLGLCDNLLKSLPTLLSDRGALLLMASSLSEQEVIEAVPREFQVERALGEIGRRVPLDVDVVWGNAAWQKRLLADGRIERDGSGTLWHRLQPLWITRGEK